MVLPNIGIEYHWSAVLYIYISNVPYLTFLNAYVIIA